MRIVVASDSGVSQVSTDGMSLFDALASFLGSRPSARQVSIDGIQLLTEQGADDTVKEGSFVQVTSAAIAQKGVSGA